MAGKGLPDGIYTQFFTYCLLGFRWKCCYTVHVLGGTLALVGAIMLGPRIGRFYADGNPVRFMDISLALKLAALGGLILFLGFLGFNGGLQGLISNPGGGVVVAELIVNTIILSGGVSALCALFINLRCYKKNMWS
ncbi:putative ammonium transporter 1 [Anneissia japonica]|uniref:putative ammonium transporter 1 n=1 Tax=Anneissia japonica TaxID=1529436 RepID=UPI001425569C|nr:putative ammonium transporter 1 [Anneissia japonica]